MNPRITPRTFMDATMLGLLIFVSPAFAQLAFGG